jgi:hypothetical protein
MTSTPVSGLVPANASTLSEVPGQKKPQATPPSLAAGHFRLGRLEEAAGACGGRGQLWDFNSVFVDNGTLNVFLCA